MSVDSNNEMKPDITHCSCLISCISVSDLEM